MKKFHAEIVIIGGGIAGLWTFAELRRQGYSPILIEKNSLGGTQSLASQGMIHGGQRYSLQGVLSKHTASISEMPAIWDSALEGTGRVDLRSTKVLSDKQYLWSPGDVFSNVTAFFASKAMNTKVAALDKNSYPDIFRNQKFTGKIYEMPEKVLDIKSLSKALISGLEESLYQAEILDIIVEDNRIKELVFENCTLSADFFICTAGSGNQKFLEKLSPNKELWQLRPLKQVLVQTVEQSFYGHCITSDPRPRVTVSAHPLDQGGYVWYLGGLVAVNATGKKDEEAISFAKKELKTLFPWIKWDEKEWNCLAIDRAEPKAQNGLLPEGPTVLEYENAVVCWPTKLTFAPALSENIQSIISKKFGSRLQKEDIKNTCPEPLPLPLAQIGIYPWENAEWKK